MADYRRFISYMYLYEGDIRGRNTGFVKVEARGCYRRIEAVVRRQPLLDGLASVWVFYRQGKMCRGILLGRMTISGGNGNFLWSSLKDTVEASSCVFEELAGLLVWSEKSAHLGVTLWDDEPFSMGFFRPEGAQLRVAQIDEPCAQAGVREGAYSQESPENEYSEETDSQESRENEYSEETDSQESRENECSEETDVKESRENECSEEMDVKESRENECSEENDSQESLENEYSEETDSQESPENEYSEENDSQESPENGYSEETDSQESLENKCSEETDSQESPENECSEETDSQESLENECSEETDSQESRENEYLEEMDSQENAKNECSKDAEIADSGACLQQEMERHTAAEKKWDEFGMDLESFFPQGTAWERLCQNCPKIRPFAWKKEWYCLKIKPGDLGRLPKENWILGNNSFMLHGYYVHRYLILMQMNQDGKERYILGVPGIYGNRERMMAEMFGFGEFLATSQRRLFSGQRGFWCVNVTVG